MDAGFLIVLLRILAVIAVSIFGVWLLVKLLMGLGLLVGALGRGIGHVGRRIGAFVSGEVGDVVRLAGGIVTSIVFVPMALVSVVMGRWSRANHYGRALEREAVGVGTAAWRIVLGHPARLLGLDGLVEGVEHRIPEVMARAPGPDLPGRADRFDGYTVMGSLPSGGSGARLFLAEPDAHKRAQLAGAGRVVADRVVIKSFSLEDGSSMPQIVRESRALEAARKLGLVLEHELHGTRFHYVMPYVPGEDLHEVTQRMHQESGPPGLGPRQLQQAVSYIADLLSTLHAFHANGLWHKDVKPNNIIVSGGRVKLVDLGLTTPLASAMTLTTHGTEYFRDPELVRLALRGVKVHEVDGVKFDIYGAGAVLYSMIENSFPAHGSLSQITRRCPEALRWIVRRAMADMSNRYGSTTEMLADVRHVLLSRDPFGVKPAQLPSMSGRPGDLERLERELSAASLGATPFPATPAASPMPAPAPSGFRARCGIRRRRSREAAPAGVTIGDPAGPATGRRGRTSGGLLLAGGLVMLLLGAGVLSLMVHGGSVSTRPSASTWSEVLGADAPPHTQALIGASASVGGQTNASAAASHAWTSRRPEPTVVLLLDDVPAAASELTQRVIAQRFDDLETARFELVGGDRDSDMDPARQIELRAEARRALELDDPRDPGARERLTSFVERHRDEIGGLLWVGRDEDDPDRIAYQFIPTRNEDRVDVQRIMEPGHDADAAMTKTVYSIY